MIPSLKPIKLRGISPEGPPDPEPLCAHRGYGSPCPEHDLPRLTPDNAGITPIYATLGHTISSPHAGAP